MDHPDIYKFIQYVSGNGTDDLNFEMDSHIAECGECLEQVRALLFLRNNFSRIFDSWTAKEYGEAVKSLKYVKCLIRLSGSASIIPEKMLSFCKNIINGTGIAVNALLSNAKKIASLSIESVKADYRFRLTPAFAGVGTPESAGLEEKIAEGSRQLSIGNTDEALKILSEVSVKNGRSVQSRIVEIFDDTKRIARVVVDSRKKSALIMYWAENNQSAPAYACAIPDNPGSDPLLSEFLPVEGTNYMLAEIRNIPDGAFSILM